ncbi:orotidine-5'-phosphate decarboxylase [Candidatus Aerophobetes bacterium]|nr:orotidine-5'-phosphate decarboxylase [Candidatus Aerophobetes bacterium]
MCGNKKNQEEQLKERVILALDVDSLDEAKKYILKLKGEVKLFKIGIRLFFSCGPQIIDVVREKDGEVFLDAKFHDIPSVVEAAVRIAGKKGVKMITVHTLGGVEMMRRAKKALQEENPEAKVLGVTLLTSLDQRALEEELGIKEELGRKVLFLASMARKAGLDGVVCSGWEVENLRSFFGRDFLLVVPGIRMESLKEDEQKRVLTPGEAILKGATHIVVGRPVLQASDPVLEVKKIFENIKEKIWQN